MSRFPDVAGGHTGAAAKEEGLDALWSAELGCLETAEDAVLDDVVREGTGVKMNRAEPVGKSEK